MVHDAQDGLNAPAFAAPHHLQDRFRAVGEVLPLDKNIVKAALAVDLRDHWERLRIWQPMTGLPWRSFSKTRFVFIIARSSSNVYQWEPSRFFSGMPRCRAKSSKQSAAAWMAVRQRVSGPAKCFSLMQLQSVAPRAFSKAAQ